MPAKIHEGESLYTESDPRGTWNHATTFQQLNPRAVKIKYIKKYILQGSLWLEIMINEITTTNWAKAFNTYKIKNIPRG